MKAKLLKFWHKYFYSISRKLLLIFVISLFLIPLLLTSRYVSYSLYSFLVPRISNKCFTDASSSTKHFVKYSRHKQIIWFKPDKLKRTRGVHLQIAKNELVNQSTSVLPQLIPKGYVPYRFDSLTFVSFDLLSKQTILSAPFVNDVNYQNNVYTIPTNIAQSGLFAQSIAKKKETYQYALSNIDKASAYSYVTAPYGFNVLNRTANSFVPKYLNQGKNKKLVAYLDYVDINDGVPINPLFIQVSPNYINEQLAKKLSALPKGYHLDLIIKLNYNANELIPRSINYKWTFLHKNKQGRVLKQTYPLPIWQAKNKRTYSKLRINVRFPVGLNSYFWSNMTYGELNDPTVLFAGQMPKSIYHDGYRIYNDIPVGEDWSDKFYSLSKREHHLATTPLICGMTANTSAYWEIYLFCELIVAVILFLVWLIVKFACQLKK